MSMLLPNTLTARLAALAQRFGLGNQAPRRIFEKACQLRLPFAPLPKIEPSIWWQAGPPLQRLVELPRGALSGPVQEHKADAHAVLIRLVERKQHQLPSIDLRQVDGLNNGNVELPPTPSFEDYLASLHIRSVKIISYKDFIKAISLPLPRFLAGDPINLYRASWHGSRMFWCGEQHTEAFAAAISYARLRQLETTLPAEVTHYQLRPEGLAQLDMRYHVLAMPTQAWSDPAFMGLLLDTGIPYSRLKLLRNVGAPEFLMLPKDHVEATALGEGLRLVGATDVVRYLSALS
ncbi:DUF6685 family protein [Metapseudomonas boanensis]|uniref:Uncharacterized protein n=1 Tax=Metapseudomonas boanensis TaxID=2822138 RepID=A0ABS5XD60_9GAMM|nr:DUF6685 family protein [Pseudomonas boanensis]MBT8765126.1 hypothetical protein [Pseudomonas boanensis]